MNSDSLRIEPLERPPDVSLVVPGSKSHTNRALVCAALADGPSELGGVLAADDTAAMMAALTQLGVTFRPSARTVDTESSTQAKDVDRITVSGGLGLGTEVSSDSPVIELDVRQSGTTGRFLLPVLAGLPGRYLLDGDPQLRSRPFGPQLEALRGLGADVVGERLPLVISGTTLDGKTLEVDGSVSSQFLSGLLLAAPRFAARSEIRVAGELVSRPYIELTVDTMASFGVEVVVDHDYRRFLVEPQPYLPARFDLEPDASAASYFFGAAAITGGRVRIDGLGSNTVQGDLGFVRLLEKMGAEVIIGPNWTEVRGGRPLVGINADMSDMSDTAQTMAVVSTFATTPTEITGIGFIRKKETDRVAAVAAELTKLGIEITTTDDGWIIHPGRPNPGTVETYDDHRMAMSFAILGLAHPGIELADPGCVSKTFPNYFEVLDQLRG